MVRVLFFCGATLACVAPVLAADADPLEGKRHAKQMFQANPRQASILTGEPRLTLSDAKLYRATQGVLIKSERVLASALRTTDLTDSGLFPDNVDELKWVRERLVVDFPADSNVLTIAFVHPTAPREAMVDLVNAISKAYRDEVIFESKIQRQKPRDILVSSYRDLSDEISRKRKTYEAILLDSPSVRLPQVAAQVALTKEQIGRLQAEKIAVGRDLLKQRVEIKLRDLPAEQKEEQLTVLTTAYEAYTSEIDKQVDQLTQEVLGLSEEDSSVTARAEEVEVLRKIQREIAERIEAWDVELKAPDTVLPFGGVEFHDPASKDDAKRAMLRVS